MKSYHVNTPNDWGYVWRAMIDGEWVEMGRKESTPPFATVEASSLSVALWAARVLYGHNVIVSEIGIMRSSTGLQACSSPPPQP